MAALERLLDETAAGRPQVVLLTGQAGVGKTRLLGMVAARGGEALVGGCVPLGEPHLSYAPIVEVRMSCLAYSPPRNGSNARQPNRGPTLGAAP